MADQDVVVRRTFFDLDDNTHLNHQDRARGRACSDSVLEHGRDSGKDADVKSEACCGLSDEETDTPSNFSSFTSMSDVSTPSFAAHRGPMGPPPGCFAKPMAPQPVAAQPFMWMAADNGIFWVPAQVSFIAIPAVGQTTRSAANAQERRSRNHASMKNGARGAKTAGLCRERRSDGARQARTPILPEPVKDMPEVSGAARTTVMLRNMPNNYSRDLLMELLDAEGFAGLYDFVYLPVDFQTRACLGYAFVNLVDSATAMLFWRTFDGFSKWAIPSRKQSGVSWSGHLQGLDAHVERYRNSPVMAESIPDAYKPVLLVDGTRVPFPPPTKKLKALRLKDCQPVAIPDFGRD